MDFIDEADGPHCCDAGAETALSNGKSLLPAGVTGVEGEFARGDAVVICSASGQELAHGISAYPSDEARALMGRNTRYEEIWDIRAARPWCTAMTWRHKE